MNRLLVACAIALAGCGGAAPRCELPPAVASAQPFLWKATRAGDAPLWLFGTVHNISGVPDGVMRALATTPRFVSELGDLEPDRDRIVAVMELPRGQSLPGLLGDDDWYDLRDVLRGVVDEDSLRRARPWFAMTRLTATVAPAENPVIDAELTARARDAHLPIEHLETWDEQLGALVDSVSVEDLRVALHARGTMRCEFERLKQTYRNGDADAIAPMIAPRDPEHLLWQRNRAWLPQLEAYAKDGGAFVAVGLGHLLGDHGVVALLAADGYAVERVSSP